MANVKISELNALTPPDAADLVPVTDSSASQTKRTTVGEIVGIINGDVDVANDGTATISELPVSKLQDGAARQLLQTDAAGTDVEWTDDVDLPGTLDVTGVATLDDALNVAGLAILDGGIDVDGVFTVADATGNVSTSGTLGVSGQSTLASAAVSDLTSGRVVLAGASGEIEDSANLVFNGSELGITGTLDVSSNATVGGDLTVVGDLTVEGATTTLETQTVTVEDKNIELGVVGTPTDTTADGGGITLKGATDKTINWVDATDAWTFSEHVDIASAKEFRIAGTKVLDATSLGSAVVSSSLTSVGTIGTGIWQGTTIATGYGGTGIAGGYTNGELLIGKTDGTLAKATLTAGNGIDITNADGSIAIDVDLKANGGLVLESTELAVDLGASAITGTLGVADGGTGQTTYTDGELLIGTTAGSLAKATITAGSGIDVTNGDGSIAVAIDSSVVTTSDTGTVTSTMILDGTIVNGDINASAAIADTKLDTISTAGKVSNSATTATDANTANAIVARDASGDFTAGTITADLTGNADTATALETARDIGGVSFDGTANINLPGVNTTGNQDTSGNAATATKLDSSRTFEVTGDVTGTVSSDLTSGASIATSIASGVIVDADVNASAAIAGTKIDPDFGAQNVETTGDLDINTGLLRVTSSSSAIGFFSATPAAQPIAIADITSTATSGALPTPDGSITIADATTPTVTELLEYCVELEAKIESALAALRTLGLIAT
jgi:hypothetical protein